MSKIEAVVFDLYGTLIDSPARKRPFFNLFSQLGLSPEEALAARETVMTKKFKTLEEVVEDIKPGAVIDLAPIYKELKEKLAETYAYPEAIPVLERLKESGIKIGLISNLSWHFRKPFFDLGLAEFFDEIALSFLVGCRKPNPAIYQEMIDRLGIKPKKILMTGDQLAKDVEAPRQMGMQAVHLDRSGRSPESIATLDGIFQYL